MNGVERLTSRRIWFVPDVMIWGMAGLGETAYLVSETVNGVTSVLYGSSPVGPAEQEIAFADLRDHRGNSLPATLRSPRVFTRNRDSHPVFVVSMESPERFKIARDASAPGPVATDLLVVELGD